MKGRKYCFLIAVFFLLALTGCGAGNRGGQDKIPQETEYGTGDKSMGGGMQAEQETEDGDTGMNDIVLENFTMENGKTVYLYVPQDIKKHPKDKVPLVLFMCGTSCDPVDNVVESGWTALAEKENFIVISPDYNNYATYSETDFLASVVEYMIASYPVDRTRIYSTGFSNGGAASVALTRDYPEYFAAISAMGWMVDLDNQDNVFDNYDMPFQVVQGNGEFTEKTGSGSVMVMKDERDAIQSLFLYNEMIGEGSTPDYDRTPYWGYEPDETRTLTMDGMQWELSSYYKEGFSVPFAQLVLAEDSEHRPRRPEAEVAWEFFRRFGRDGNGRLVELSE